MTGSTLNNNGSFLSRVNSQIQLVECPRDAMQGWKTIISTKQKVAYLNSLLQVGFDTLDCGSFVSPKAVPQMADTREVLNKISCVGSRTKILVIVANVRGAEEAVQFENVTYLGFPFSISPTFQKLNTNSTIEDSVKRVDEIQSLCIKYNKQLVIYLSMGFGNPYGDEYDEEILLHWADEMVKKGITIVSLADTVGVATADQIEFALGTLIPTFPQTQFGVHLHSTELDCQEKINVAAQAGCTRFDGALMGVGGCPMSNNPLVGNINTERMIDYFKANNKILGLNEGALQNSLAMAAEIFKM